jgi:hypothetical protein
MNQFNPHGPQRVATQNPNPSPNQPVAYDQYGNPLYAHPPEQPDQPQVVHLSRAVQPIEQDVPPEIQARHDESMRRFPTLNLSREEYLISAIKRHPIGLLKIWGIALLLIVAFMGLMVGFFLNNGADSFGSLQSGNFTMIGAGLLLILSVVVVIGALVATYVYNNNRFFLTNESVVQEIQTSPFSKKEQTVSLSNIEDASYKQGGILQTLLNYGTIRLSTEGDETTYRFTYVTNPKKHIAVLNNAVENFKNGRPVEAPEQD